MKTLETQTNPTLRHHDMDCLRALMMLIGLVFHVIWFFQPFYFFTPISDSAGAVPYLYVFTWVHQFRMQVFFLIAGFFACLLVRKRGTASFWKNRFWRVAVPFALAMVTLFPLMKLQYLRGGLLSGRILSDQPLATQFWQEWTTFNWRLEWPMHLWFLQALLILYAITWVVRVALVSVVDRQGKFRDVVRKSILTTLFHPLGVLLLAVPVAVFMMEDTRWFGIGTGPLDLNWSGVFAYWVFFVVGWCLFQAPERINKLKNRWLPLVLIGSMISIGLTAHFYRLMRDGKENFSYPAVADTEFNYSLLRQQLLAADQGDASEPIYPMLWKSLSPAHQSLIRQNASLDQDRLQGLATEITAVAIMAPEFAEEVIDLANAPEITNDPVTGQHSPAVMREWLAVATGGIIKPKYHPSWSERIIYFYGYSVSSWMLVLGMLGLFRRYASKPSATIRYLADSSYWLYLIHLPIQFEISLYLAPWDANGPLKFLIYNALTFAITLPTYHYLVRPTWVGRLLNGRSYQIGKQTLDSPVPAVS